MDTDFFLLQKHILYISFFHAEISSLLDITGKKFAKIAIALKSKMSQSDI